MKKHRILRNQHKLAELQQLLQHPVLELITPEMLGVPWEPPELREFGELCYVLCLELISACEAPVAEAQ